MKKKYYQAKRLILGWIIVTAVFGWTGHCRAGGLLTFNDMEKPTPKFTRTEDNITAKFIPRAKSTSVELQFGVVSGGSLEKVRGIDFDAVARPEVDEKNFKSAVFEIRVGKIAPGGQASISIDSDFFTSATAFYVFNPKLTPAWSIPKITNRPLKQRVRQLIVIAKDGGPLDSDGTADGKIILTGGPRDSFWGYALGTLFIRFFGIFLVLSMLMVGMMLSGFIFKRLERRNQEKLQIETAVYQSTSAPPEAKPADEPLEPSVTEASDEEAAVIALALNLHFNHRRTKSEMSATAPEPATGGTWAEAGRIRSMNDRLKVFTRPR